MRIGISVLTHAGQNIWENGLGQNVIFLAQAFQKLPFVQSVVLLNGGDQSTMPPQVNMDALGLRMMSAHEATDHIDLAIEMAGALDVKWLDYLRAQGKKVVWYCAGQPYVGLIEPSVFDRPGFFSRADRCDEIWILPKDFSAFAPMLRALHRCPVHEVPYIWSPQFLDARARELEKEGYAFGYKARAAGAGLRVAIFEPNVSVVKCTNIPMLVCDEAFRADPAQVNFMHVLNTLHLKDHPTLLYLANSLDLVKQQKAIFQGRHDFAGYMVQHADAVVAHQWQNDQNYNYLDALHGNYPLIHNSPWLRDAGYSDYYYPDFNTVEGGRKLLLAASQHDSRLEQHRQQARRVITSVDPFAHANLQSLARRLQALFSNTAGVGAAA
ncbi:Protein of unknown function (DUF2827) [Polaromonas sp. CF318]|uniref:DUF2827 domain-containing protein n=1 Tax=Polaromonas sp. CF318 TaxID=1144318 RepID=UPI000270F1C6|nr:DUF2827 domain-containing protein [Polaromonas sp. CF318]EJL89167.1 Protein of unknown function (DUF2827) [Polaromonas sp. CF318]